MDVIDLHNVAPHEQFPGYHARFVHSANMTFAHWDIEAGATVPEHAHDHEQVVNVLEGEFELTVSGESRVLGPGTVVVVPSNARHAGRAVTGCRILDVFYPVRQDYRR
jgi:quercetin dioxygenase-like cupin family protein